MTVFPTPHAFYAAVAADLRLYSPEIDYGVWWRASGDKLGTRRITWVQNTGEVVAFASPNGHAEILEVVPAATDGQPPQATVDVVLSGWETVCGTDGGLDWIRGRLQQYADLGADLFRGGRAPERRRLDQSVLDAYERVERELADRRDRAALQLASGPPGTVVPLSTARRRP